MRQTHSASTSCICVWRKRECFIEFSDAKPLTGTRRGLSCLKLDVMFYMTALEIFPCFFLFYKKKKKNLAQKLRSDPKCGFGELLQP